MITAFQPLCTLGVTHSYYGGPCDDFAFLVPADTAGTLGSRRLLAKDRDGVLHILFETDGTNAPLRPLASIRLRFGVQLRNPRFTLVTAATAATPLYRNIGDAEQLDPPLTVQLVGCRFRHRIQTNQRPVTVVVRCADGREAAVETLGVDDPRTSLDVDLSGWPPGHYRVEEPSVAAVDVYVDDEFHRQGVFAVVEIEIGAGFAAAAPALVMPFAARDDILKYYLVVANHSEAEFISLTVTDTGFAGEQRPQILFDRVESAAFGEDDLPPELLAAADQRLVLFRSRQAVARRQRARRNIQLSRNGDVLIRHLPQVGAADVHGDVVIHISKP